MDAPTVMTTPDPEHNAREVLAFLNGEGPLEGLYFDESDGPERKRFWWRAYLPLIGAALTTPPPRQEEAVAVDEQDRIDAADDAVLLASLSPRSSIPAGMKPWAGGDSAPGDWDGGPVTWSDGGTGTPTFLAWRHGEENWPYVIAYTPRATPDTAPLSGEDAPAAGDVAGESDRNCTDTSGSERLRSGVTDFAAAPPVIAPGEERELARRLYRGLEMQAAIMRDPKRTGGWEGAANVANAFERQAERAKELHDLLAQPRQTDETVERLRKAASALCERYGALAEHDRTGAADLGEEQFHAGRALAAVTLAGMIGALATPADDGEQRG